MYTISLKLKPETYQQFQNIQQKLNAGDREAQAKPLGETLAKISCEVIDQAFGQISSTGSSDKDSQKVLNQVKDAMMKYMPWSVSFFGNDRLIPLVNHLNQHAIHEKEGQAYISYQVEKVIVNELLGCVEKLKEGQNQYIQPGLKAFIKVVDQGVTSLIREPKKMLKFNMVVDKTLNGVINLTTQLGYKRFEKLSTMYDAQRIGGYFDHFLVFLDKDANNKAS